MACSQSRAEHGMNPVGGIYNLLGYSVLVHSGHRSLAKSLRFAKERKEEGARSPDAYHRELSKNTFIREERRHEFTAKYAGQIAGVLNGFDRLVLRGTLRQIAGRVPSQQPG